MKSKIIKTFFILYLILFINGHDGWAQEMGSFPEPPKLLKSELSKDTILIGDQVVWTMPTIAQEGSTILFAVELKKELIQGVEVLETKIDTIRTKRSKDWTLLGKVKITSFDSGSYILPPIPFYLRHPSGVIDTLWFEGKHLEVTTFSIDTATYQPFDIKGQISYPLTAKEVVIRAGLIFLILLIAYFVYRWIRYQRENRPIFGKAKPKEPAYLVAFRQLEEIKTQKLWQNGRVKVFYTAVTDVLRIYATERWGIQAMEQTSAEFIDALGHQEIDVAIKRELYELLEMADLVKFAKYEPNASDNESTIPIAVHFVQETMIITQEDE